MKHKIKYLLALSFLFSLPACVKLRSPEEEKPTEEVIQKILEDAIIEGEMYLYAGRIMSKEDYELALNEDKKSRGSAQPNSDETIEVRNLDMRENAVLYTMGKVVRMTVASLEVEKGARIATFPANQVAAQGSDGRDGGMLILHFIKAKGQLAIELRGEKGGQGVRGPSRTPEMNGKRGPDIKIQGSKSGGNNFVCTRPEEAQGTPGEKGKQGGVGYRGGHSGKLDLQVQEADRFDVQVNRFAGEEGVGGPGGEGGIGGEGGTYWCGGKWTKRQKAPQGPNGQDGDPGPPGNKGALESYCITIQGEMTCQD